MLTGKVCYTRSFSVVARFIRMITDIMCFRQSFAKLLTPLSKNGAENVSTFILVTQKYQSCFSPPPQINVDVLLKMMYRVGILVNIERGNGGFRNESYDTFNCPILSVGVSKHFANDCLNLVIWKIGVDQCS